MISNADAVRVVMGVFLEIPRFIMGVFLEIPRTITADISDKVPAVKYSSKLNLVLIPVLRFMCGYLDLPVRKSIVKDKLIGVTPFYLQSGHLFLVLAFDYSDIQALRLTLEMVGKLEATDEEKLKLIRESNILFKYSPL